MIKKKVEKGRSRPLNLTAPVKSYPATQLRFLVRTIIYGNSSDADALEKPFGCDSETHCTGYELYTDFCYYYYYYY